jgi:hypothetical protein
MSRLRPHTFVAAAVGVALVAGALIGLAGASAKLTSGGVAQACVAKANGAVTFVNPHHKCPKRGSSTLLNQVGPRGQIGKTGKTGKTGLPGGLGAAGPVGPTGPAGPANEEVVLGPVETLSGADNTGQSTGEVAVSTASCTAATNPANVEAYGGGVNVLTSPTTSNKDIIDVQSSYPGTAASSGGATGFGLTAPLATPVPQGSGTGANAWTGIAVVGLLKDINDDPDTASVQTYVDCGL